MSVGEEEKAQKLIKGSISKDGLNVYHNQSELNNRYRAVAEHKSTIRSLNKTIRSVNLAIENLDKSTASVISAVSINLGARTAVSHEPRALHRSALNLHHVINALVDAGWTPVRATLLVMSCKSSLLRCSRYPKAK